MGPYGHHHQDANRYAHKGTEHQSAEKERPDPKQCHGSGFKKSSKEASYARALNTQTKLWSKQAQMLAPEIATYSMYLRTPGSLSIAIKPAVKDD